jgi:hypothetical protein
MENKVNSDLYVEKNGKRVYVCCQMCIEKVENDFEKYYNKAYKK